MSMTASTVTPPNVPSAAGRKDLFEDIAVASWVSGDGDKSPGGAARASSQAATCGGDGGNSVGRPRATQKS
jgi:hypothetical protein